MKTKNHEKKSIGASCINVNYINNTNLIKKVILIIYNEKQQQQLNNLVLNRDSLVFNCDSH